MLNVAVYKVLIGDYDELSPDFFSISDNTSFVHFDYYMFSDREITLPIPWKLIVINRDYDSPAVENRHYKMVIPDILHRYDYTIYLDSNIAIVKNLDKMLTRISQDNHYLYAYPHFRNNSIGDEIVNCYIFSKITFKEMTKVKLFLRESLGKKVAFECGVLVRKKPNCMTEKFSQRWFELYINNVRRDQFYFQLALSENNLICHPLGINTIRSDNGEFKLYGHKKNIKLKDKILIAIKMRLFRYNKS